MAISIAPVHSGPTSFVADVAASADADTVAVVPHGLPSIPAVALAVPFGDTVAARLSEWGVLGVDATNVTIEKTTAVGSGAINAQVRVIAMVPHTIIE